jgi:hypothetical protein
LNEFGVLAWQLIWSPCERARGSVIWQPVDPEALAPKNQDRLPQATQRTTRCPDRARVEPQEE